MSRRSADIAREEVNEETRTMIVKESPVVITGGGSRQDPNMMMRVPDTPQFWMIHRIDAALHKATDDISTEDTTVSGGFIPCFSQQLERLLVRVGGRSETDDLDSAIDFTGLAP